MLPSWLVPSAVSVVAASAIVVLLTQWRLLLRRKIEPQVSEGFEATEFWRKFEMVARVIAAFTTVAIFVGTGGSIMYSLYILSVTTLLSRPIGAWLTGRPEPPRTAAVFSFVSVVVVVLSLLLIWGAARLLIQTGELRISAGGLTDAQATIIDTIAQVLLRLFILSTPVVLLALADLLTHRGWRLVPAMGYVLALIAFGLTYGAYLRNQEALQWRDQKEGRVEQARQSARHVAMGFIKKRCDTFLTDA